MHHFIALFLGLNQGWKAQPIEFQHINHVVNKRQQYYKSKRVNGIVLYKILDRGRDALVGKQQPMGNHNFLAYLADSDHVLVRPGLFSDGTHR